MIFEHPITVTAEHIDVLNHVNNRVFFGWLLDAANAHSTALGYPISRYLDEGACFVVRRHEIEYLAPAHLGDQLVIETWVKNMQGVRSTRGYVIKRLSDDRKMVTGETDWVFVDVKTGRPKEIPQAIREAFWPGGPNPRSTGG